MLDVQETVPTGDDAEVVSGSNGNGNGHSGTDAPAYRIDQKLHQILYKEPERPKLEVSEDDEVLPEPVYPQHPDPVEMTRRNIRS